MPDSGVGERPNPYLVSGRGVSGSTSNYGGVFWVGLYLAEPSEATIPIILFRKKPFPRTFWRIQLPQAVSDGPRMIIERRLVALLKLEGGYS